jgi:hypothetical protein
MGYDLVQTWRPWRSDPDGVIMGYVTAWANNFTYATVKVNVDSPG